MRDQGRSRKSHEKKTGTKDRAGRKEKLRWVDLIDGEYDETKESYINDIDGNEEDEMDVGGNEQQNNGDKDGTDGLDGGGGQRKMQLMNP